MTELFDMDHPDLKEIQEKCIPILAWCDHEADTFYISEDSKHLTLYAAHGEALSYAPNGWNIIVWGGAFDDSTWEYPIQGSLPDWWFVAGSDFEVVANPVKWCRLPNNGEKP